MANLETIVSRKTENDTQWKARQQADRENLMALQDAGVLEITSSAEAYTRYQQLGHNQEQIQQESAGKPENVLAGVVGALLGCLLGVGCIVLLGQLGYVAALSGIVLAVCTLKGYELLGGRLSTKGIVIACVLMLAMTYVGYRLDWAITVAKYFEASLTDSYRAIPYLIDEEILDGGVYTGELIKLYAFTLIGAIPTIINSVKNWKMAKVTYRMQSQRAVNSTPEF